MEGYLRLDINEIKALEENGYCDVVFTDRRIHRITKDDIFIDEETVDELNEYLD